MAETVTHLSEESYEPRDTGGISARAYCGVLSGLSRSMSKRGDSGPCTRRRQGACLLVTLTRCARTLCSVRARRARCGCGETGRYLPGAPELAVEVIPPEDTYAGAEGKVAPSRCARMVIVVNPLNRVVKVHRDPGGVMTLSGDDKIDSADVVPWVASVGAIAVLL